MVEYTIDDIRGPTVAREMAQLKSFVLEKFNGAIADAETAAAAAATAAANAVLANTVKKTGEASQSIAGNVGVAGTLDATSIGSGSTPVVCGNLTAYGNVSLDDTVLQGNLSGADSSALINLAGVGSVLVPDSTLGSYASKDAVNAPRLKDELDNYAPMVRTSGNQTIAGTKTITKPLIYAPGDWHASFTTTPSVGNIVLFAKLKNQNTGSFVHIEVIQASNTAIAYGLALIGNRSPPSGIWAVRKTKGPNNPLTIDSLVIVTDSNNEIYLGCRRKVQYGYLKCRVAMSYNYGNVKDTPSSDVDWLDTGIDIGDGTGYTLEEMTE